MPDFPIDLQSLEQLVRHADVRVVGAAAGVVLLTAGARVYALAIMAPGFALGLWLAHTYLPDMAPVWRFGITVGAGALGALVTSRVEQLAVRLAGSILVAGTAYAILPLVWTGPVPWYAAPAAGFLGLALFPSIYRRLLPLITSVLGALMLAWSLDRPTDLLLIIGTATVGVLIQLILSRSAKSKDKK